MASRVVLVGGGDLAEIAVLAAVGEEVTLLGIVDPERTRRTRYGIRVGPRLAAFEGVEVAIVTDLTSPQETFEALRSQLPAGHVFAPEILRITPDRVAMSRRLPAGPRHEEMECRRHSAAPGGTGGNQPAPAGLRGPAAETVAAAPARPSRRYDVGPAVSGLSVHCDGHMLREVALHQQHLRRTPCPVSRRGARAVQSGFVETLLASADKAGVVALPDDGQACAGARSAAALDFRSVRQFCRNAVEPRGKRPRGDAAQSFGTRGPSLGVAQSGHCARLKFRTIVTVGQRVSGSPVRR